MAEPAPTCDLLQRLSRQRDPTAWGLLLERHGGFLARCARARCGDSHLADDAVQEALLYVRDHAAACRANDEAGAVRWLQQVVGSSAAQVLRRHRRQRDRDHRAGALRQPDPVPSGEDAIAERDLAEALHRALGSLPERHRRVLELRFFAGLGHAELGEALTCSPATARVRTHRALKLLQRRLAGAGFALGLGALGGELAAATASGVPSATTILHQPTRTAAEYAMVPCTGGILMPGFALVGASTLVAALTLSNLPAAATDGVPIGRSPAEDAPTHDDRDGGDVIPAVDEAQPVGIVAAVRTNADGEQDLVMVTGRGFRQGQTLQVLGADLQGATMTVVKVFDDMVACRVRAADPPAPAIRQGDRIAALVGAAPAVEGGLPKAPDRLAAPDDRAVIEAEPADGDRVLRARVAGVTADADGTQTGVVLQAQGAEPAPEAGEEFILYRGNRYLVKARVERVTDAGWRCRIMDDTWNSAGLVVEIGDQAQNRLF